MRNGRLAQSAAALYLFLRDVCGGNFIGWIDDHLSRSNEPDAAPIIEAMRHIHGVSDKVLSLALVVLLLGGRPDDSLWQAAGAQLIVIDTLVHNWLHRSGILNALDARHRYGPKYGAVAEFCVGEGEPVDLDIGEAVVNASTSRGAISFRLSEHVRALAFGSSQDPAGVDIVVLAVSRCSRPYRRRAAYQPQDLTLTFCRTISPWEETCRRPFKFRRSWPTDTGQKAAGLFAVEYQNEGALAWD